MIILGIETSCDETAVGIVNDAGDVLANEIASQIETHAYYGGVVPEIAARAHLEKLDGLIKGALAKAGLGFGDITGVASTIGPGLIGGVMVGAMAGKAIAAVRDIPFVGVNHLEAHALTVRLTHKIDFPYLLLLVSGGHSQILLVHGVGDYELLGTTKDDAVGECFDKGAKLLGLGYPGGPKLEQAAKNGDAKKYPLPRPMLGRAGCDFSFSGLKTALRLLVEVEESPSEQFIANAAASYQMAIADILADRVKNAIVALQGMGQSINNLVVAGGVAANSEVRNRLTRLAQEYDVGFVAPPMGLCTDNGVMIAWAGLERLRLGLVSGLDVATRPRWPLDEKAGGEEA